MKKILLFAFFLLMANSHAQELHFENFELKLPSTETYQIFQDSKGFIWVATDAGICKYDGNTLTAYTTKDGISDNVVLKIYEDSKKRVWFNSVSGHFFYYENGHFTNIAANEQLSKLCKPGIVTAFMVGEKDTLYLSTVSKSGLIKVPPQYNYQKVIQQFGSFHADALRYIFPNRANNSEVLIGGGMETNQKDSIYDLYLYDTLISISIKGIKGDYFGTILGEVQKNKDETIYLLNRNILTTIRKDRKTIQNYSLPSDILKIYLDNEGDLWVGTRSNGGYFYKQADLNNPPIHFLSNLSISSIIVDKEGSVWATTLEKGIFQCMNKHVNTIYGKAIDLKIYNDQLQILQLPKQSIAVSAKGTLQSIKDIDLLPKNSHILSFLKQKDGTYYSTSGGLFYIHGNNISTIPNANKSAMIAKQLLELSNDTILCLSTGFIDIIHNQKVVDHLYYSLSATRAVQLADKRILIGSRNKEGIFELKNNKLLPFLNQYKELKTRINSITEDTKGNLWIATNEKGVFCYTKNNQLHQFNEEKGLISNKVNTCISFDNGDIWCGTHSGLSKFTLVDNVNSIQIENFSKNHGVVDQEIERMIQFNNTLWCAGKTALFYFDPKDMKKNTCPPPAYLHFLKINNKDYQTDSPLTLNYNENNFVVQCGLISLKKTPTQKFLYKLTNFDKAWKVSNTGDINYTNLKYGSYTLLVYGLNNDGLKSVTPVSLTLTIKKPFWYTWWFISIEILILLVLLYLAAYYWKKKIEKKERDKAAISEFKMTALRSQMNPHFIFNALGSIQYFILENNKKESNYYLSRFALLIRNILNNSNQEYITLSQEINTLKLYIELEQIRFAPPFQFILEIDEELDMESYIPTMLIQPYIENAVWHGLMKKKSAGTLQLIFEKQLNLIKVIIKDDGIGRNQKTDKNKTHMSKGMSITEQRIKILENASSKKYKIVIIDLKDEEGQPSGTEVNLFIPCDF